MLVACASDPAKLVRDFSKQPGYHVSGNQVLDGNGQPHLFHGVARPTLEWSATGENISPGDFQKMASWKANVVRIGLNQDYWLLPTYAEGYQKVVLQAVEWAKQAGLDVILDLHWSDRGDFTVQPNQQLMADQNSITFWKSMAQTFKDDGRVLFELYNEPEGIPWDVWLNGGPVTGQNGEMTAAGMQQMADAIRAAEDPNLRHILIAGGVNWAYDLSGVATHQVKGDDIMYATHPYDYGNKQPADWDRAFGYLTQSVPVIATEFGSFDCSTGYTSQVIDYADAHGASWTGWAWYVQGCSFPSLITSWDGTPSAPGAVVKAALAGYADGSRPITFPPPAPFPDAGVIEPGRTDAGASTRAIDSLPADAETVESGSGG